MKFQTSQFLVNNQVVSLLPTNTNILNYARRVACEYAGKGEDSAFAVCDVGQLLHQHVAWFEQLPRVLPYYAVKCNNDPVILGTLANMGLGFDCASKKEIATILSLGVAPERIIYANPCKPRSHLRYANEMGVDLMTFDNDQELYKVKQLNPKAKLVLRIAVSDPTALCQLNLKFGAEPVEKAPALLKLASLLDLNVVGISFHVGSGCRDPEAYAIAIAHARRLFDLGLDLGHEMEIVDLGGGYPGYDSQEITFAQIASVINASLDTYFPAGSGARIIAEPGRYYAASTTMSVVNVIAKSELPAEQITKKDADTGKRGFMYYVNDGVYGSMNCILYDHVHPDAVPMRNSLDEEKKFPCSIWGPTCDSMDCITPLGEQPELQIGDWLYFENMGAYTLSAFTEFNGFEKPAVVYFVKENDWKVLKTYFVASAVNEDIIRYDDNLVRDLVVRLLSTSTGQDNGLGEGPLDITGNTEAFEAGSSPQARTEEGDSSYPSSELGNAVNLDDSDLDGQFYSKANFKDFRREADAFADDLSSIFGANSEF